MDYINDLHELCETISNEISEANQKIRDAGGKLTGADMDYIDKLTHSLKSIKAVIAMMEGEGNSYDGGNGMYRGSYRGSYRGNGGGSYRSRSYARRRDAMGRYSGDGDLVEQLHELMQDAPNENVRREMQRLAEKIEQQM